jgi:hypothetical protein
VSNALNKSIKEKKEKTHQKQCHKQKHKDKKIKPLQAKSMLKKKGEKEKKTS